jgi:hypothetical protein
LIGSDYKLTAVDVNSNNKFLERIRADREDKRGKRREEKRRGCSYLTLPDLTVLL